MSLLKPYKVLLILGNGFDLSLNLPTSYRKFLESDLFSKNVNRIHYHNGKIDQHDRNLFNYLTEQKRLNEWIDVEEELMKYASNQRVEYHNMKGGILSCPNTSDEQIKASYSILCFALQTYMASLDYSVIKKDALSLQLLETIIRHKQNSIVSFNYTDLANLVKGKIKSNVEYIHGNIKRGIILGFQRFENMALGYEYMIKSENVLYKSCHLSSKMLEADEVIIFGHSLGVTDHCYFQKFFDAQTRDNALPKKITIITLDRDSRKKIVQQMVNLSNKKYQLFLDNTDVNVIETKNNKDSYFQFVKDLDQLLKQGRFYSLFHSNKA